MRPPVDEMANADLDGDEFWICERKEILDTYKVSPPWEVPMKEPGEPKPREAPADLEAFEAEHWQMFLDAFIRPDYTKGQAANAWLASMDKHIVCVKDGAAFSPYLEKCLKLVDIYFKALDAEKTGVKVKGISQDLKEVKRPHFMVEPGSQQSGDTYVSNSILGQVYDLVKDPSKSGFLPTEFPIELDQKFEVEGFKVFWGKWSDLLMSYNEEMRHILSGEPDLRDKKCEELTLEYRQILYGGPDLINATKDFDLMKKEASAIYGVVYTRAKVHENNDWKGASLRFAWTVAGDALLEILRRPGWWTVDPTVMPELVARLAAA